MSYINVGVEPPYNKTKKALKEGVAREPGNVRFYSTALFGQQFNGTAEEVPEGVVLTCVGPSPATKRSWYASVEKKNGKVVVS